MAVVYFDSSALFKLVYGEASSDLASELWNRADVIVCSTLAYVEVRAALAAARRARRLSMHELGVAKDLWEEFWPAAHHVTPTADLIAEAAELAEHHALRGYDAVHLATALHLADPALLLVSWDDRLRAGAHAAGLVTVP